jgi:hypothetical protein
VDSARPLDPDEIALLDALREGAGVAIDTKASPTTEWDDVGGDNVWPIFVLRPEGATGVEARVWMSDEPHERRSDFVVAHFALVDFSKRGILGRLGGGDMRSLSDGIGRFILALVEGSATYRAAEADPEHYDGPIAPETLAVFLGWTHRTENGSGGGTVLGTLEDPAGFANLTGIPIAEQIGQTHTFPAFSKRV